MNFILNLSYELNHAHEDGIFTKSNIAQSTNCQGEFHNTICFNVAFDGFYTCCSNLLQPLRHGLSTLLRGVLYKMNIYYYVMKLKHNFPFHSVAIQHRLLLV